MGTGIRQFLRRLGLFSVLVLLLPLSVAQAEEAAEGEDSAKPASQVKYVALKPAIVTNYQTEKLRYFQAEVTIKADNSATADAIERHKPYIRHGLVMLFSSQDKESLNSIEGKTELQNMAVASIVETLQAESEPADVSAVLFTSFIVE